MEIFVVESVDGWTDGRTSLNFKLMRDLMAVLLACKNEEDPIRNEGAGAFTTSFPL